MGGGPISLIFQISVEHGLRTVFKFLSKRRPTGAGTEKPNQGQQNYISLLGNWRSGSGPQRSIWLSMKGEGVAYKF